MNMPQTRLGGTNSFKVGSLKRRLDPVIVAILDNTVGGPAVPTSETRRIVLKNLNGDLNIHVCAAAVGPTDGTSIQPAELAAGAATMQLTPVVYTGTQSKIFLRPVFQDPVAAQNENHPLPQDLPFGWEFSTEADEVYIDIVMNLVLLDNGGDGPGSEGNIIVQCTIEYNGQWWDTEAVKFALGQVQMTGTGQPLIVGTAAI